MRISRSAEPQGAAIARAPFERPKSVTVSLFRSLIDGLTEDRRRVILDLGRVHPCMLKLIEGRRCRLDVADLVDDLSSAEYWADAGRLDDESVFTTFRYAEPADIVLCWDLLNYLDRNALQALMALVAACCRAGALVHALVVYSERVMHEAPGQLVPIDAGTLFDVAATQPMRPAPRYSTEDLSKAMPDYMVDRVRLLSNGMQEYLFKTRAVRDALDDTPESATPRKGKSGGSKTRSAVRRAASGS